MVQLEALTKQRVPGRKTKFLLMEKVTKVNLQPGATVCQSNRGGEKKTSTTAELAKRTHSRSGSWITIREFVKLLAVVQSDDSRILLVVTPARMFRMTTKVDIRRCFIILFRILSRTANRTLRLPFGPRFLPLSLRTARSDAASPSPSRNLGSSSFIEAQWISSDFILQVSD